MTKRIVGRKDFLTILLHYAVKNETDKHLSMVNGKYASLLVNKGALHRPVAQNQVLLPCRMRLTKQPFKQDRGSPVMHSSHLDVDLIQHARQHSQRKSRAVQ